MRKRGIYWYIHNTSLTFERELSLVHHHIKLNRRQWWHWLMPGRWRMGPCSARSVQIVFWEDIHSLLYGLLFEVPIPQPLGISVKCENNNDHIGFVMGIPQVRNFNTIPAPVYTVPIQPWCLTKPTVSSVPVGNWHKDYYETTNCILLSMTYWLLNYLNIWIWFLSLPLGISSHSRKNIIKKNKILAAPGTETKEWVNSWSTEAVASER